MMDVCVCVRDYVCVCFMMFVFHEELAKYELRRSHLYIIYVCPSPPSPPPPTHTESDLRLLS